MALKRGELRIGAPQESPEKRRYREEREEKAIKRGHNFAGVYLEWLFKGDVGARGAARAIEESRAKGNDPQPT